MSTQVAPEVNVHELLSQGWRCSSAGDGGHYCHNEGTGQRTDAKPTPKAAYQAAAEMQAAGSGKRAVVEPTVAETAAPPPDWEAALAALEAAQTLLDLYKALRLYGLDRLADSGLDDRFTFGQVDRINEALTNCEERLEASGVKPGSFSRLYELDILLDELNADGHEVTAETTAEAMRLTAERAELLGLNEGVVGGDPFDGAEAVAPSSSSDEAENQATASVEEAHAFDSPCPHDEDEGALVDDDGTALLRPDEIAEVVEWEAATLDPAPYVPDEHAETKPAAGETNVAFTETKPAPVLLDPGLIRTDGGTQARAQLDERTVAEYAERMLDGNIFPPVVVFYDGAEYWLGDGFHRHAATLRAELAEIAADVRQGTRRDAVLYAVGANARHGLPRTDADKRRAVETLLRDPDWSKWSNREVARQCGVSKSFVGSVREELTGSRTPEEVRAARGGTEYTVKTAGITAGGKRGGDQPVESPVAGAPAEAAPSSALQQSSAPEIEASPEAATPAADAIKVNDRRRFVEESVAAAHATHPVAKPDRLADLKRRLRGRALIISHTFMGDLGVMVTVNISGADPSDAINSKLFDPEKVKWLGDVEYEVACQRLDAEKSKPKPSTKAPPKAAAKSSKKAAPAKKTDGPATCSNCSKRIKEGRTHTHIAKGKCAEYVLPATTAAPKDGMLVTVRGSSKSAAKAAREFQIGDVVRVVDKGDRNHGMRGEVRGYYTVNKDKFQVKVGVKFYQYAASQLTAEKDTATRGATKKAVKEGK